MVRRRSFVVLALLVCGLAVPVPSFAQGGDEPAAARFSSGAPVGLYFMTRFWSGSLEKAVWYFAPDGTVYQNLTDGFSAAELAAHKGRKGKATRAGEQLVVEWADGRGATRSVYKATSTGFSWNAGIFTPVKPLPNAAALAGAYSGGNSLSGASGWIAGSSGLELKADGTYSRGNVASSSSRTSQSTVSTGAQGSTAGRWSPSRYTITFTDASGRTVRQIAFPFDDQLYIGGIMFKRR